MSCLHLVIVQSPFQEGSSSVSLRREREEWKRERERERERARESEREGERETEKISVVDHASFRGRLIKNPCDTEGF